MNSSEDKENAKPNEPFEHDKSLDEESELIKEINVLFKKFDNNMDTVKNLEYEIKKNLEQADDILLQIFDKLGDTVPTEDLHIGEEIKTLDDLILIAKKYGTPMTTSYKNIDTKILYDLITPLEKLKNIIGMNDIKNQIIEQIISSMQSMYDEDMIFHTVIAGPPGVGKTMLAKILGEIYLKMGILKGNKLIFKTAKRSDLIGKYLGHTSIKTQDMIDSCIGGVLFIDEIYSLGNDEKRDTFAKECIDTINLNLTEKKNFICIIAGYVDEIEKCFFSFNSGLKRRFPFHYEIKDYTATELRKIFVFKLIQSKWNIDLDFTQIDNFIQTNKEDFKYFGGDIDNLILNCKTLHSRRIFGKNNVLKKTITYDDFINGFNRMKQNKSKQEPNIPPYGIYL